ncbi:hypothetical protein HRR83_008342 [Exophiala dermatitidis]|uniref:Uncharacterized protein n=2 Tax=Exophiala dermatitidis TaxID=5970 RepID=H6C592_EXODN|nr:uncharacterized protein HMPREF1120_07786 [Exophiala dermatitidis NIH/UT8656]KAJ4505446.1 hypothetical protein HRR75_007315 [Exophiala dermatitidis]EHY59804.1 hypothetical protein HMPREF1120_07786 [Exophiala dermatitidis NIH/UT8656]KAJ4507046.1 hypothetical protein HRR73_007867 [Exophiala dermatitidis]KAJ4507642.1 hypothetical protein HRR74_007969 [Exophiala dermatitidis]KAJ4533056.1 hypothetical protein HRR76_008026 [Exophiala dermatitidis]
MSDAGPISDSRELLSNLKKDTHDVARSDAPEVTKEHVQSAMGKFASAIAQHKGAQNLQRGSNNTIAQVPMADGTVDKKAVQESLDAKAQAMMPPNGQPIPRGSETSRLQSAADQYRLAQEGS